MVSLTVKEVFCLVYSLLLFLSGLALIVFSVILSYKIFYNFKFFPSVTVWPFVLLFLLGFVHLLSTWLAVRGPTIKHDFHIIVFIVVTSMLFLAEFSIGVWNIVLWNNVDLESVMLLTESFENAIKGDFAKNSDWSRIQVKLRCCGLNGVKDFKQTGGSHPSSCCIEHKGYNTTCFDDGCRQPLADYTTGIMLNGVLMCFLCCFLQALGIFLFYSFYRTLKRDRDIKSARRLAIAKELAEKSEHSTPLTQSPQCSAPPVYYTPTKNETPKSSKRRDSKTSLPLTPPIQANA